jgi:hypothetical protein
MEPFIIGPTVTVGVLVKALYIYIGLQSTYTIVEFMAMRGDKDGRSTKN